MDQYVCLCVIIGLMLLLNKNAFVYTYECGFMGVDVGVGV